MEALLKSPTGEGDLPFNCPRFPNGLSERFRIVRIDVDVPDEGVPTMAIALNVPAFLTPVEPPEVTTTEPLTEAEAERKAAQAKAAKEETVSVEEAKAAEEEQAKEKAEAELLAQQEAEALAAQVAADQAAALAAGLTPAQVVKLSPKELHEKYGPLGPVGVVKLKKAIQKTAAEANDAREKSEQAQRTAVEAKGGGGGYEDAISIGAVPYKKVETAEKACLLIVYFGGNVKVFVNGGETAGGESASGTITLPLVAGDKWVLEGAGFNQVSIANLK
jgi:hypothetical protein